MQSTVRGLSPSRNGRSPSSSAQASRSRAPSVVTSSSVWRPVPWLCSFLRMSRRMSGTTRPGTNFLNSSRTAAKPSSVFHRVERHEVEALLERAPREVADRARRAATARRRARACPRRPAPRSSCSMISCESPTAAVGAARRTGSCPWAPCRAASPRLVRDLGHPQVALELGAERTEVRRASTAASAAGTG